jgi:hypothetical protein
VCASAVIVLFTRRSTLTRETTRKRESERAREERRDEKTIG